MNRIERAQVAADETENYHEATNVLGRLGTYLATVKDPAAVRQFATVLRVDTEIMRSALSVREGLATVLENVARMTLANIDNPDGIQFIGTRLLEDLFSVVTLIKGASPARHDDLVGEPPFLGHSFR